MEENIITKEISVKFKNGCIGKLKVERDCLEVGICLGCSYSPTECLGFNDVFDKESLNELCRSLEIDGKAYRPAKRSVENMIDGGWDIFSRCFEIGQIIKTVCPGWCEMYSEGMINCNSSNPFCLFKNLLYD